MKNLLRLCVRLVISVTILIGVFWIALAVMDELTIGQVYRDGVLYDDGFTKWRLRRVTPRIIARHARMVKYCKGRDEVALLAEGHMELFNDRAAAWGALAWIASVTEDPAVKSYRSRHLASDRALASEGVQSGE